MPFGAWRLRSLTGLRGPKFRAIPVFPATSRGVRTNTDDRPAPAGPNHLRIAGGGPAGVMLGFLLARAGVEVVVLEKHRDFLRDFRGDTIHPRPCR